MEEAIAAATEIPDEVPVGAVLVDKKQNIITRSGNRTKLGNDPTNHAEMMVIKEGCKILGSERLRDCSLYVTIEPCAMCAAAISYARIGNLYYGARDQKFGAVESNIRIFHSNLALHKPEIYSGLCENKCAQLLKQFFSHRRA